MTRPHVHPCPERYADAPCGMRCEIIADEEDGEPLPRADACVCGLCLRRAGLAPDVFITIEPLPPHRTASIRPGRQA